MERSLSPATSATTAVLANKSVGNTKSGAKKIKKGQLSSRSSRMRREDRRKALISKKSNTVLMSKQEKNG